MKLPHQIKDYIKNSIYEISVNQVKIMLELYNINELERAYKIIDRIRIRKRLILKWEHPTHSKFATNYYNWSDKTLIKNGYFKHGLYWIRVINN